MCEHKRNDKAGGERQNTRASPATTTWGTANVDQGPYWSISFTKSIKISAGSIKSSWLWTSGTFLWLAVMGWWGRFSAREPWVRAPPAPASYALFCGFDREGLIGWFEMWPKAKGVRAFQGTDISWPCV